MDSPKSDPQSILCTSCRTTFLDGAKYELHCQRQAPPLRCDICPETFTTQCEYTSHLHLHSPQRNASPTAADLQPEMQFFNLSHTPQQQPLHTVPMPPPPSQRAQNGQNAPKNLFVCKVCGRAFQHRSSFRAHEPTHTGVKPFQCNICQKRFALQWNLVSHLHTHTGKRRYKCHKCHSMFARSTTLREHMQVHLPLHEKPICRCDICGKIFRSRKSLSGHRIVHSKRRPFICDICERGFVSRRNLRNHQKSHVNIQLMRCDVCDIYFRNSINLAVHRAEKHFTPEYTNFPKIISDLAFKVESQQPSMEGMKYPCEHCQTYFSEKIVWVEHMQKHFVEQFRSVCYVCGQTNASLESLRLHLTQHKSLIPPPPSSSPPKLAVSNYDVKYFLSFFSNNSLGLPGDAQQADAPSHSLVGGGNFKKENAL